MLAAIAAGKSDITLKAGTYDFTASADASIFNRHYDRRQGPDPTRPGRCEGHPELQALRRDVKSFRLEGLAIDGNAKALGTAIEIGTADVNISSVTL